MNKIIKAGKRVIRILMFKKGIYGKYGKCNKFGKNVFLSEGAAIGSYNYVGPYSMINNAQVENYCSIGPGVKIGQAEHSISYWTTSQLISKKLINHSLNIEKSIIGNDVWLAANVTVLQGVKIGDGCVVGANAVVTKDLPPYSIAVGVPAKVIKYRFDERKINQLKDHYWYNKSLNEAIEILKGLGD
ncbi:CatB-related O-acetyltransferase [Macrococcoides canis]|uniref:CatB-related O-acetyltransferase n=1 Tax=Macrococcoides canis TaxID=1855823 RepID=UPI0020B893A3|nr:CatB-related O-acetyltransferase [Macrococcus canis]UTH12345.1 CatB-related O-acetyltransferase [Macrococcus canis]